MYAVIQTGGKQYRVQEGDVLRLDKLNAEPGKKVTFDQVLLIGEGDGIKMGADAATARVSAEVIGEGRGRKIVVFKKRRRKNSQLTQGHRQAYTSVRITKISAARAAPAKKAEKPAEEKAAVKKVVAKAPAEKKTASKKATSESEAKPAVKKPAAKVTGTRKSAKKE